MTRISSPRPSHSSPAFPQHLVWTTIGLGVAATALCGSFLFAEPLGSPLNFSPSAHDRTVPLAQLFGANGASARSETKILTGVGGETFAPGANRAVQAVSDEIISDGATANIKPVAWERLSGGGCMIVTTKSGQSYSFRVQGARPAPAKDANAARAAVELAIGPCAENAESIVKAVIVPPPEPPHKPANPERSL